MRQTLFLSATLALVSVASASAQTTPASNPGSTSNTPPARPVVACATETPRHQFDFWIGEWDVTTKDGKRAGSSVVESVSGGCALLENWTSGSGGHGKSLNAWNPSIRQWQQYWIGQDGAPTEFRSSEFDGKSLAFFDREVTDSLSFSRMTFTPLDASTVRQHAEKTTDGGKTWSTTYDLYYHRRK